MQDSLLGGECEGISKTPPSPTLVHTMSHTPERRPRTPAHPQPAPLSCKRIALSARVESGAICCDVDAGRVPLCPFAHSA
ncbi:uncharacterized protein Dsimw501_GD27370 [Drosophila simulans]|uniref:Uncharacterized protein n=1 Tax=Drosophila simulans TaxID=7240 RepID=A0A0J9UL69_DROSI|nr:uncharacterized protein Dsimw501_GD27370 [Drosophila simulans]